MTGLLSLASCTPSPQAGSRTPPPAGLRGILGGDDWLALHDEAPAFVKTMHDLLRDQPLEDRAAVAHAQRGRLRRGASRRRRPAAQAQPRSRRRRPPGRGAAALRRRTRVPRDGVTALPTLDEFLSVCRLHSHLGDWPFDKLPASHGAIRSGNRGWFALLDAAGLLGPAAVGAVTFPDLDGWSEPDALLARELVVGARAWALTQ